MIGAKNLIVVTCLSTAFVIIMDKLGLIEKIARLIP